MEIPVAAEIAQCVYNVFEKLEQELLDSRFLQFKSNKRIHGDECNGKYPIINQNMKSELITMDTSNQY